jgi:hypothetical protein
MILEAAAKIRADAEAEAVKLKEGARAELSGERDKMLSELRGQIAALAIVVATRRINKKIPGALIAVIGTIVPSRDSSGRDLEFMIEDIVKNPEAYLHKLWHWRQRVFY